MSETDEDPIYSIKEIFLIPVNLPYYRGKASGPNQSVYDKPNFPVPSSCRSFTVECDLKRKNFVYHSVRTLDGPKIIPRQKLFCQTHNKYTYTTLHVNIFSKKSDSKAGRGKIEAKDWITKALVDEILTVFIMVKISTHILMVTIISILSSNYTVLYYFILFNKITMIVERIRTKGNSGFLV